MADNLQTAIDYLNNSVKLLPNNPFKTELTKNSSNDDKFMALCYVMQQTYGLSLTGQMDTPTVRRLEKEGDNISILNGGEYDINRFVGIALTLLGYDIGDPLSKYTSSAVRDAANDQINKLGAYGSMTLWGMPKGHLIAILAGEQADLNPTIGSKNVQNAQRDINHIITNDGEFARLVATDGVFKPYMLHSLTQCLYSVTGISKENDDFDTVINPAKLISAGYSEFDRSKIWYKLHNLLISALELADVFPMELTSDTNSLYLTDKNIEAGIVAFGKKYNATGYTITDDNVILSLRYVYSLFTHKVMNDNEFVKVPFKIEDGYEIDGLKSNIIFDEAQAMSHLVIQAFTPCDDPKVNPPLVLINDDDGKSHDLKEMNNKVFQTVYDSDSHHLFVENTNAPWIILDQRAGGHTQTLFYANKNNVDKLFVGCKFAVNPKNTNTNWAQSIGLIDNKQATYTDLSQIAILTGIANADDDNYRLEACADFESNPNQFLLVKTELDNGKTTITGYNFTDILNALSSNKNADISKFKNLFQYEYSHMNSLSKGGFGSLQGFSKLPAVKALLVSTGSAPKGNYDNNDPKRHSSNYGFYILPLTKQSNMLDVPLIDLLSSDRIQNNINKYYQDVFKLITGWNNIPASAYSYQTEVEAVNAIDANSAWIMTSTHLKINTTEETLKQKIINIIQKALAGVLVNNHKNFDFNMLYKVSW